MKAAQLLVLQALLLSFTLAHRHRHYTLVQQDDTSEVELIVSDFSQEQNLNSLLKTPPVSLPQVSIQPSSPHKLTNEDLLSTVEQKADYDEVDKNSYSQDELEALTDNAKAGSKKRDLFYYGLRPDPKPVAKPKAEHKEAPKPPANATKEQKAAAVQLAVKMHQDEKMKAKQARRAQAMKDAQDEDEYDTHMNFESIDNTPI